MKVNGKLIESFVNAFDSSLVDYSGDFEKSDKNKLESNFVDSLYFYAHEERSNGIYNAIKNVEGPETPDQFTLIWTQFSNLLSDESIVTFKDTKDTLTLYVNIKGYVFKNYKWATLLKTFFSGTYSNRFSTSMSYDRISDLIELFAIDTIDYGGDDFFQRWNSYLDAVKVANRMSKDLKDTLKELNGYIKENPILVYIKDNGVKKYFKNKKMNIVFTFNTPYRTIHEILYKGYKDLIDYFKHHPEECLKVFTEADWYKDNPEGCINEFFRDKDSPYYNFDKGNNYIIKGLNKLKTIRDIDYFFAEFYGNIDDMLKDLKTKLKYSDDEINKVKISWILFQHAGFGYIDSDDNDPSIGIRSKDYNFLRNNIEIGPIKTIFITDEI